MPDARAAALVAELEAVRAVVAQAVHVLSYADRDDEAAATALDLLRGAAPAPRTTGQEWVP